MCSKSVAKLCTHCWNLEDYSYRLKREHRRVMLNGPHATLGWVELLSPASCAAVGRYILVAQRHDAIPSSSPRTKAAAAEPPPLFPNRGTNPRPATGGGRSRRLVAGPRHSILLVCGGAASHSGASSGERRREGGVATTSAVLWECEYFRPLFFSFFSR